MITRPWRWLGVMVTVEATAAWALTVLMGPGVLIPATVAGAAGLAVTWAREWRTPADRERHRVVGRALRRWEDPGPAWRDEVTDDARQRLGRPASDRWAPGAVCALLAAACVVAALLRGDWTDALPAVPLLAIGALVVRWVSQALLDASRWLDSPPYPLDATAAEG